MTTSIGKAVAAVAAVSALLLLPGQAAAKAAPVREAGVEWLLSPGLDFCGLRTMVAGGKSVASIGIKPDIRTGTLVAINLTMRDRAPAGGYKVNVKINGGVPHVIDAMRATMPRFDVLGLMFSAEDLAAIAGGTGVLIGLPGESVMVETAGWRNDMPLATICSRATYFSGLKSPPDLRRIVTWPKPVVPLAGLINSIDYRRNFQNPDDGLVNVLVRVDADGRVSECVAAQTSHANDLNLAACDVLKARGRYEPARDAAGIAVESADRIWILWTNR